MQRKPSVGPVRSSEAGTASSVSLPQQRAIILPPAASAEPGTALDDSKHTQLYLLAKRACAAIGSPSVRQAAGEALDAAYATLPIQEAERWAADFIRGVNARAQDEELERRSMALNLREMKS